MSGSEDDGIKVSGPIQSGRVVFVPYDDDIYCGTAKRVCQETLDVEFFYGAHLITKTIPRELVFEHVHEAVQYWLDHHKEKVAAFKRRHSDTIRYLNRRKRK